MTRLVTITVVIVVTLITYQIFNKSERRYWLNMTDSEPVGLYRLEKLTAPPRLGDIVIMVCPPGYERYLYGRKWLPSGWPLFKTIGGVPGDIFCISSTGFTINNKFIGPVYRHDREGRELPIMNGCKNVRANYVLPVATGLKTSFDGRYFGDVPLSLIKGKAVPMVTF